MDHQGSLFYRIYAQESMDRKFIYYTNQILVSVGGDLGPAHIFNLTLSELVRC